MTGYTFKYIDPSGTELSVANGGTYQAIRLGSASDAYRTRAELNREAVKGLWLALGEWLHPDAGEAPLPYANRSLIEQLIERAVKDQVAAVLPLHLAPVRSTALNASEAHCDSPFCLVPPNDPEPHDVGHADEPLCTWPNCKHPRSDHGQGFSTACDCGACSEYTTVAPQVVAYVSERPAGHPTEDEWAQAPGRRVGNDGVALPYCKEQYGGCGHSWGQHTGGECKARNFDLSNRAHNPCGCAARPQASTS